ncbi:MAG: hypothetical protein R3C53_23200 [Pirellulaceae bacterium]
MSSMPSGVSAPAQTAPARSGTERTEEVRHSLHRHLRKTAQFIKILDTLVIAFAWMAAILAIWLVACVVDHWLWPLPVLARWGFWFVCVGLTTWWTVRYLVPLLIHRINPVYAARRIENLVPEFKNGLVSWLELESLPGHGVPRGVMAALTYRAARFIGGQDPSATVDTSQLIKLIGGVLLLATSLGVYSMVSPKSTLETGKRIAFPWSSITSPTRVQVLDVLPGEVELTQGKPLEVEAQLRGLFSEEPVFVRFSTLDGQLTDRRLQLTPVTEGLRYQGQVTTSSTGVEHELNYWIEAGDARRGPFRVTLSPLPMVALESVTLHFPKYTKLPSRTVSSGSEVEAVEGTRMIIAANANQTMSRGRLEIDPELDPLGELIRSQALVEMQVDGRKLTGELPLQLNEQAENPTKVHYRIRGYNTRGDANPRPILHTLNVFADLPPEVTVLGPESRILRVSPTASVNIEVRASDPDFGLTSVHVEVRKNTIPVAKLPVLEAASLTGRQVKTLQLALSEHAAKVGDEFQIVAIAMDNRHDPRSGQPAPNRSVSEPLLLQVVGPEQVDAPERFINPDQPGTPPDENQINPSNTTSPAQQDPTQPSNQTAGNAPAEQAPPSTNSPNNTATQPENQPKSSDHTDNSAAQQSPQQGQTGNKPQQEAQEGGSQEGQPQGGSSGGQASQSGGNSPQSQSSGQSGGASSSESTGSQSSGNQPSQSTNQSPNQQNKPSGGQSGNPSNGQSSSQTGSPTGNPSSGHNTSAQSSSSQTGAQSASNSSTADQSQQDREAFERVQEYMQSNKQTNTGQSSNNPQGQQPSNQQPSNQQSGKQPTEQPASDHSKTGESGQNAGQKNQPDTPSPNSTPTDQQPGTQQSDNKQSGNQQSDNQQSGNQQSGNQQSGNQQSGNQQSGNQQSGDQQSGNQQSGNQQSGNQQSGNQQSGQQSGSQQSGNQQSGNQQSGSQQSGSQQSGNQQSGNQQSGNQQSGNQQSGNQQSGNQQSGNQQSGNQQSGDQQSGNQQSGDQQSGNQQSGSQQSGNQQSGSQQSGSQQSGSQQSGSQQSGSQQSGSQQSGSQQSGNQQSGDQQSGNQQSGNQQSGDQQSGNQQSGNQQSGNQQSGSQQSGNQQSGSQQSGNQQSGNQQSGNEQSGSQQSGSQQSGSQPSGSGSTAGASSSPQNENASPGSGSSLEGGSGGSVTGGEAANASYAEKTTQLVLDYLNRQRDQPDPELLKELDWDKSDLEQFLDRWNNARDLSSSTDERDRLKWQQMLEELGLGTRTRNAMAGSGNNDTFRQQQDGGTRIRPPENLRKQFEAFKRALQDTE